MKTDLATLIMKFAAMPKKISKEVEKSIKKSATEVRDTAVKKFGRYQPQIGPYNRWQLLSQSTSMRKEDAGSPGDDPLIGHYSKGQKNKVWPAHLRNTIGIKVEGMTAAVGSDDPLAAHHEYGAPAKNIPPRPFLRPALYENQENIKDNVKEAIREALFKM